MKKVSVIIPIFNAQKYLHKCLDSVINQTYNNLEIICVDDGSTDSSNKIIKEFQNKDHRIILLNKENGGVSSARNIGLIEATGDYLMFLDSDDYLDFNAISTCIQFLNESSIDIIRFNYIKIYKHLSINNKSYFKDECIFEYPFRDIINQIYINDNYCSACGTMYKSSIAKRHKFNEDIKIGEDFLFFINCLLDSKKIYVCNKNMYYYVFNDASATSVFNFDKYVKSIQGLIYVVNEIDNLLETKGLCPPNSNDKLERNIRDYFALAFQELGSSGVDKLNCFIHMNDGLSEILNYRKINIDKISHFSIIQKSKLIIKKRIKRFI